MQRLRILIATLVLASLVVPAASLGEETAAPGGPAPVTVKSGGKVPPLKLKAIHPGEKEPRALDLGASLGRKPVVICYLVVGESLGEEGLLSVQALMQSLARGPLKGKVEFFGAARLVANLTATSAAERLALLGIEVPLIVEEDLVLGSTLGVTSAPSITLIDSGGVLRIPDAKSLKQLVVPGVTMKQAIQSAARGGPVPTVAKLSRYYPANEMVGEPFPDFILKKFEGTERIKMSEVVAAARKEKRVPVLFFWHPNCTHCKKSMPSIMVGHNAYRKWLNLISIVDLKNADEVRNTQDVIRAHALNFPVLQDEDRRITDMYKVVSTPTFIFLKPDGAIDSVYTSADVNYVTVFSAKIRSILDIGADRK